MNSGERTKVRSPFALRGRRQRGVNLIELVAVLVIGGVIGAVALPRLWGSGYDEAVFAQEATSALRYAQRSALAKQRNVCVALTATSLTLTYASAYGSAAACNTNLAGPSGGGAPYTVNAQHGRTFGTSASFTALTLNGASSWP